MCDRIAVLRNGKLVKVLDAADRNPDEITTLMIGQALKALDRPAPVQASATTPVIEVRDLYGGTAKGVSFDVNPGEIVGLYAWSAVAVPRWPGRVADGAGPVRARATPLTGTLARPELSGSSSPRPPSSPRRPLRKGLRKAIAAAGRYPYVHV